MGRRNQRRKRMRRRQQRRAREQEAKLREQLRVSHRELGDVVELIEDMSALDRELDRMFASTQKEVDR